MYQVNIKIKGVSPMLQHKFVSGEGGRKRSGELDYSEEWRETTYADEEGNCFIPASHIEGALTKAAVDFKIRGKGNKTYKDLINATVYIQPDHIPLGIQIPENPTSNPLKPFYVDIRPVRISGRILRSRGAFAKGWEASFIIDVLDDQLPLGVLKEVLDQAGSTRGLGDYRPKFGRFIVTQFEEVE